MDAVYTVGPITAENIDKAFALVRLALPELMLDGWRRVCAAALRAGDLCSTGSRILVATDPRGYVRGLCNLAIPDRHAPQPSLDVPVLLVGSALDAAGVAGDLADALIGLCRKHRCARLAVVLPEGETTLAALLHARCRTRRTADDGIEVEITHRPYTRHSFGMP